MGDGRDPLHVCAEQPGERLGLGLTQLGKLFGDVRHRAVVLAQLYPLAHRSFSRRRSVPIAGQCSAKAVTRLAGSTPASMRR